MLWKIPVGSAFGSFAVFGGKAYYLAERGGRDVCFAVDLNSGKPIWSADVDETIFESEGGNGPRTTPAIRDGRVYALGTRLKLVCLDADSGKPLWSHDLLKEFGGRLPPAVKRWGNAVSPLLDQNRVIVSGGGRDQSLLAFNGKTGSVIWKTGSEAITHASPTPATIDGVRQVIFYTTSGLVAVNPENGAWLWHAPVKFNIATAASPVVGDDMAFCSAGYGVGASVFHIEKHGGQFTAAVAWRTPGKLMNLWSTPVFHNGYLYGLFGFKEFKTMPLKCLDLKTGKEMWSHEGFGQGGLICAGDRLLIQGDQGQLVLVDANPAAYHEVGRAQPLTGKCWQMPIVAEGKIITRSDREAVCLDAGGK